MFNPRRAQARVLEYRAGKMGISAVPGSGKTHTLSALAAKLLYDGMVKDDQEVLIVTLVNSAVDNFTNRIQGFMRTYGLIPNVGYRVRTLHGLAHDIVRERPDLAQLANDFSIIDEREAHDLLTRITEGWLLDHPEFFESWTLSESWTNRRKVEKQFFETLVSVASNYIRLAKDERVTPMELAGMINDIGVSTDLLTFGSDIYSEYQRVLNQRGTVDFDDLIRLAVQVLQADQEYLNRLRYRWQYILEDEAQDSSRLQEVILRTLSEETGNWVRVGDPNQAIFETFTTASPEYLRKFLSEPGVCYIPLPESGRSALPIMNFANRLIEWTTKEHPITALRAALSPPFIQPTVSGDPQQNPPDQAHCVNVIRTGFSADREIVKVAENVKEYLDQHSDRTVAILTTRNDRGEKMINQLKSLNVPCLEMLRSTQATRTVTSLIAAVLACIEQPNSAVRISNAYTLIQEYRSNLGDNSDAESTQATAAWLRKLTRLEDFLYPIFESSTDRYPDPMQANSIDQAGLDSIRSWFIKWYQASVLPIGQLVLLIGQDIFSNAADLGLVHKLSLLLSGLHNNNLDLSINDYIDSLNLIIKNQRKFIGFTDLDTGFNPDDFPGKVVVATLHKSKGLEWDRVYLLSINNYDFPSAQPQDTYYSEKWFIRDRLNIEAETQHQLQAVLRGNTPDLFLPEGTATDLARIDYCAERLRLLYVGITRARRELVITWNKGQKNDSTLAYPLMEMIVETGE